MLLLSALTAMYLAASICYIWPYAGVLWRMLREQHYTAALCAFLIVAAIALTPVYNLYSYIVHEQGLYFYEDREDV